MNPYTQGVCFVKETREECDENSKKLTCSRSIHEKMSTSGQILVNFWLKCLFEVVFVTQKLLFQFIHVKMIIFWSRIQKKWYFQYCCEKKPCSTPFWDRKWSKSIKSEVEFARGKLREPFYVGFYFDMVTSGWKNISFSKI